MKAMLYDSTRCIGCRGCQIACKNWNEQPAGKATFFAGPGYQNPADLNSNTWTLITYNEVERNGRFDWVFGKLQCMHCNRPSCVSACPVAALEKTALGPVIYHPERCIGCRYCQFACPFLVPRYQWEKAVPFITKCTMCYDRISNGGVPACVKVCPTRAMAFGGRDEIIREAERRIASAPSLYLHHIYGKEEAGGTCVLHLSSVPFEKLQYQPNVPEEVLHEYTHLVGIEGPILKWVVGGLAVGLAGVWALAKRKDEVSRIKSHERKEV
ncbi:MAG: 4Fe-4S dicluster domain-containing protein [Candidatus Glassbacteria bacterium]